MYPAHSSSQSAAMIQRQTADEHIHPLLAAAGENATATEAASQGDQALLQAVPMPQAPLPDCAPEIDEPGWEHRTPCERRFVGIFSDEVLRMIESDDRDGWQKYVIPLAKTDDLVMTAIALLVSSIMEFPDIKSFINQYFEHFQMLLSVRTKQGLISTDENCETLLALLIALLSQVSSPAHVSSSDSRFILFETKLLDAMTATRSSPRPDLPLHSTPEGRRAALRLFILAEMRLIKEKRQAVVANGDR
ncbi:hypothetical protein FGADI_9094 [Fusarium gaditjirri]|uniref:Uncharacterized protein n=1 Tax=Fusarium gaditjirri TaxID=282569 RepID=A0A8H4T0M1_9HYPO|nr:hypothetical protein FGADI_9094 [Fusarium gaditjirri]